MNPTPGYVFISYAHEDRVRVDRLQGVLEAAGIKVWRDTADLWPGQDWKLEIRRAIMAGSLVFLACFSENSQRRVASYQNEELILAVEQLRKRPPGSAWLIPVRFADCNIPEFDLGAGRSLDSLQRIDLFDGSWDVSASRLVSAVLRILHDPQAPTGDVPPSRPLPTSSSGTLASMTELVRGCLLEPPRCIDLYMVQPGEPEAKQVQKARAAHTLERSEELIAVWQWKWGLFSKTPDSLIFTSRGIRIFDGGRRLDIPYTEFGKYTFKHWRMDNVGEFNRTDVWVEIIGPTHWESPRMYATEDNPIIDKLNTIKGLAVR